MSQGHASWQRRLDVSLRCAHRKGTAGLSGPLLITTNLPVPTSQINY